MVLLEKLKKTFVQFCSKTSIAGISNAYQSKSLIKKVYWSTLFLVFLGLTVKGVFDNIAAYYEYAVVTSTDLVSKNSIEFPAVTICNHNKLVNSQLLIRVCPR